MKKTKRIAKSNHPVYLPFMYTAVIYLLLDKFHAPQWLWGAAGFYLLLVWIINIWALFNSEEIDIFKDK